MRMMKRSKLRYTYKPESEITGVSVGWSGDTHDGLLPMTLVFMGQTHTHCVTLTVDEARDIARRLFRAVSRLTGVEQEVQP